MNWSMLLRNEILDVGPFDLCLQINEPGKIWSSWYYETGKIDNILLSRWSCLHDAELVRRILKLCFSAMKCECIIVAGELLQRNRMLAQLVIFILFRKDEETDRVVVYIYLDIMCVIYIMYEYKGK